MFKAWKDVLGSVPDTGPPTSAEVVALPTKALDKLYRTIIEHQAEDRAIEAHIAKVKADLEQASKAAAEIIDKARVSQAKVQRDLEDRRDDFRRICGDLGVEVVWPNRESGE